MFEQNLPENLSLNYPKTPEVVDLKSLSFAELQRLSREAASLSRITFQQVENGFVNVNGDGIWIRQEGALYKVKEVSQVLQEFHSFVETGDAGQFIRNGNQNKQELLLAIRKMIEELKFRIIK